MYPEESPTANVLLIGAADGTTSSNERWSFYLTPARKINFRFRNNIGNLSVNATTTNSLTLNEWNFVRLSRGTDPEYTNVYVNTINDLFNIASASSAGWTANTKLRIGNIGTTAGAGFKGYMDAVYIGNYGFPSTGEGSLGTETNYQIYDYYTLLLNFNGTYLDQSQAVNETGAAAITAVSSLSIVSTIPKFGTASLVTTASLTCNGQFGPQEANATLTSQASVSTTGTVTRTVASALSIEAQLAVINSRTRDVAITTDSIATQLSAVAKIGDFLIAFDANITSVVSAVKTVSAQGSISSQSTLSSQAIKITSGVANINASATTTTDTARTRTTAAGISSEFVQTTAAIKSVVTQSSIASQASVLVENAGLLSGSADLQTTSTITATATRNRFAVASISSQSAVTVSAILVSQAAADISSSVTMTTANSRTRSTAVTTDSIATQLSAVAKTGQGFITLEAAATLTNQPVKTAQGASQITATTTLTAQPGTIKLANVTATVAFAVQADGVTGIIGESYNQTTVTLGCVAVKTTNVSGTNNINAELSVQAVRTRRVGIQLSASGGQLIEGIRIKFAQANISSTTTLTCLGGVNLVILNQSLFNTATLTAQVRSIHIDPYTTWIIASELRTRLLGEELRTRSIEEETRTYIIEGA